MKPLPNLPRTEMRVIATTIVIACLPLFAALASAQQTTSDRFTDPAAIDRALVDFTGVPIGQVGGARVPADRRLRLAPCASPLDVSWHGQNKAALAVECAGPRSWRIFVAAHTPVRAARAEPVVTRGDPLTVIVRGRGFTVQQAGEAMENGALGDWIAVRTDRQSEPVRARIERPGLAVIPAY